MGDLVNFPQSAKQLRELGLQAFRNGNFTQAVQHLDQLCHQFPDSVTPGDVRTLAGAYLQLDELDEAADTVRDASDDLVQDANGRYLLLQIATRQPDFPLGAYVINATTDPTEHEDNLMTMTQTMADYDETHAHEVAVTKRHLRHLGGMTVLEQERFITTELARLPFNDVVDPLSAALVDRDVHPAVRSSLVTWARVAVPTTPFPVWVYDRLVTITPAELDMPVEDATSQAVLGAIVDQLPEQEDMLESVLPTFYVLLGFLYPAVPEIITDTDEFARAALNPQRESAYSGLIEWLLAAAQQLNDAGTSLDQ
ncbi:tetratricopeptide repeat protein [Lacticaseibacillus thailandensis]|nr:tetratricopeptide repeat protein [Lacticaseibacillus thailandensis]